MDSEQMGLNQHQYSINDIDVDFSNNDFEIFDYKTLFAVESNYIINNGY